MQSSAHARLLQLTALGGPVTHGPPNVKTIVENISRFTLECLFRMRELIAAVAVDDKGVKRLLRRARV